MSKKTVGIDPAKPGADSTVICVDLAHVKQLVQDGSDIVLSAAAEDALYDLLKLEELIKGAIATAKRNIEERALEYNPNFTSVQGTKVKVGYQFFGSKYSIDESKLRYLPKDLYKEKITYSPIGPAIDKYAKEKGKLPAAIIERDRTRSITVKPVDKFEDGEF